MLTTLATLAALALAQQTDTTVPVRAGARLEISNFGGEIAVKTWSRDTREGARSYRLEQRQRRDPCYGGIGRPHRGNGERRHHAHANRIGQCRSEHGQRGHHLRRDDQGRRPLSLWDA